MSTTAHRRKPVAQAAKAKAKAKATTESRDEALQRLERIRQEFIDSPHPSPSKQAPPISKSPLPLVDLFREYVPKVGEVIWLKLPPVGLEGTINSGNADKLEEDVYTVTAIRDLLTDPLEFDEFCELSMRKIGRYLVEVRCEESTAVREFFWNEAIITCYWDEDDRNGNEVSPDWMHQPNDHSVALQMVVNLSGHWMECADTYGPAMSDRLRLIADFAKARNSSSDAGNDLIRVRPVIV